MFKITMKVEGMMCAHCEAHMNEAIKNAFKVKSVESSHSDCRTEILSKEDIAPEKILEAVKETGYTVSDIKSEEFKKKFSIFGR